MKKINIIQFSPYLPPHKGGLETVGKEISKYWIKKSYGKIINITTHFNQDFYLNDKEVEKVLFCGKEIGYKKDGYVVLIVPSIEIVYNFPVFKIWSSDYKLIEMYLKEELLSKKNDFRVITHTRFFLTSLIGGLFARKHNIKWIHIEHGSCYPKLSSKFKTFVGIVYDKIIGKWIFKKSDKILPISNACKNFVLSFDCSKKMEDKIDVFYRGLDLGNIDINKTGDIKIVFVGRLVSLKGVSDLIKAYIELGIKNELIIIGDGEEKSSLKEESKGGNINFVGFKDNDFIIDFLLKNNCILVNPSYQEGLPTTVIEGLATGSIVIATDIGGTSEISNKEDLILFNSGDIKTLKEKLKYGIKNYDKLNGLSLKTIDFKFNRGNNISNLYKVIK